MKAGFIRPQTDAEKRLLTALADMCRQYLTTRDGSLDDLCMSAGEEALDILEAYGLVQIHGPRHATWTEEGKKGA